MISSTNKENNMTSTAKNSKGYLVCEKCKGRYELQDGESPNDFESCECGGSLKYFENEELTTESNDLNAKLDNPKLEKSNVNIEAENSDEIIRDRISKLLKTGTLEKGDLKELSKQKNVEDEILRDIKEDDWTLEDLLREKSVQIDAKDQKILLNEVLNQEEKFSMLIEKQNKKAAQSNNNSILKNGWIYVIIFFAIVFVIFFMMLNNV